MQVFVNSNYPGRIQIALGSITGPLSVGPAPFDPRQNVTVYVDGDVLPILSYSYDIPTNEYRLFSSRVFSINSVVQVLYAMPDTPFQGVNSVLPGFASIAQVVTTLDVLTPALGLSITTPVALPSAPFPFVWSAVGVAQVRITASNGYDSGLLAAAPSAGVVYASGFTTAGSYTGTIAAYDVNGAAVLIGGVALSLSKAFVITTT